MSTISISLTIGPLQFIALVSTLLLYSELLLFLLLFSTFCISIEVDLATLLSYYVLVLLWTPDNLHATLASELDSQMMMSKPSLSTQILHGRRQVAIDRELFRFSGLYS